MAARWVAFVLGLAMLAIVGIFVWAVIRPPAPISSATDRASPSAVLRMLEMAMEPEHVVLVQNGPGLWRGSTQVSMAGRWNLRVEVNGETVDVPFEARSR